MTVHVDVTDPSVLIRIRAPFARACRPWPYEATRGVWGMGPRREDVRHAPALYQGIVEEVYEIHHWQPAHTDRYTTRTLESMAAGGRSEFVGAIASEPARSRYRGKSVAHYFVTRNQNPITYAGLPNADPQV